MTVAVAAFFQLLDQYGKPVSGGRVYTYAAGTLVPLPTYTDQTGAVPNPNPVILDAAGRAQIWLTANVAYKLIGRDAADVLIPNATTDNYYAGASPEQLTIAGIVPATGGTYTGPVNFNGAVLFNGTPAQEAATLDSLSLAGVATTNLWINSDFAIWQRSAAASAADGTYGFDRTVALCETGSVTLSQLAQPTDGIPYAMRMLQPDASAKRVGAVQIVEARNCLAYRGGDLVFAPKLRASVGTTVRVALVAWTGTADAPTRDVVNNWSSTTYTAGNFFVTNTSTIAVGSATLTANTWTDVAVSRASAGGVVAPSTMTNLYLVYWTDTAVAQNVTLDASVMRAGRGTNLPLWTPPDAAAETDKCLRYFYRQTAPTTTATLGTGAYVSATQAIFYHPFPHLMRALPTASIVNAGAWGAVSGAGLLSLGLGAIDNVTTSGIQTFFSAAATSTNGYGAVIRQGTVGNYVQADAEL